jgi:serine/threonine protein kinase
MKRRARPQDSFRVDNFDLQPGRVIGRKYEVSEWLGEGWEGEVYKIVEISTGIERAAKLFYPQRNRRDRAAKLYARRLHRLRHCPIVIQYHAREEMRYRKGVITVLISEYVDGEKLSDFLARQPGRRLQPFQAVHLLYALAAGMEQVHHAREYHGDLHTENVIVHRYGLGFDLKLLDVYEWSAPKRENIQSDILDMIRIFYDVLGGARHYARQPRNVRDICCGLKQSLILKKFPTTSRLKDHLESMRWD